MLQFCSLFCVHMWKTLKMPNIAYYLNLWVIESKFYFIVVLRKCLLVNDYNKVKNKEKKTSVSKEKH